MNLKKNILVSVVGPTAVGKTALAIEIAKYFNTEIVSADSRQFYREMNIGTAKPDKEELAQVKTSLYRFTFYQKPLQCGGVWRKRHLHYWMSCFNATMW